MAQFTDRLSREATDVDYVSAHLPRTLSPTQGFTFERNWEAGEPWETLLLSEAALHVWWATVLFFWMTWLSVALCGICICRLHWSAAFCLSQSDLSAVISVLEHCCSVQRAVTLVQLAFVNWDVTWRQALLPLFFSRGKKKPDLDKMWCVHFHAFLQANPWHCTLDVQWSNACLLYWCVSRCFLAKWKVSTATDCQERWTKARDQTASTAKTTWKHSRWEHLHSA